MLARFVPLGVREPDFELEAVPAAPATSAPLMRSGLAAGAVLAVAAALLVAVLDAMDAVRTKPGTGFDLGDALWRLSHPTAIGGWVQIAGILAFAAVGGMFVAAIRARKH